MPEIFEKRPINTHIGGFIYMSMKKNLIKGMQNYGEMLKVIGTL